MSEAKENFEQLTALIASGEIAYSAAQDTLKEIDAALITISTEQDKFAEELRSLRKDELEARDDAERMRRAIITLDRKNGTRAFTRSSRRVFITTRTYG